MKNICCLNEFFNVGSLSSQYLFMIMWSQHEGMKWQYHFSILQYLSQKNHKTLKSFFFEFRFEILYYFLSKLYFSFDKHCCTINHKQITTTRQHSLFKSPLKKNKDIKKMKFTKIKVHFVITPVILVYNSAASGKTLYILHSFLEIACFTRQGQCS